MRLPKIKTAVLASLALAALLGAAAADEAKPAVKIGYLPITDQLTVIAKARSQFKHLEFQPVKFSGWAELAEAVKAGAVDGAFLLTPIGITLRGKGVPLKAVLLGHRNGSAITVREGGDIKDAAGLKGKTVAVPSRFSTHNILLRKLLQEKGIDAAKDVKILEMAPPEMVNALAVGRLDAFIVAEPFGAQAELQKVGRPIAYSKDIWPNHICCVLNLNEKLVKAHPEAVRELVAALVDAGRFIEADPAAAATLSKPFLGQKPEVVLRVLTTPKGRVTYDQLIPELSDFEKTQDYMLQYGLAQKKIDLGQYVDGSFAREAYGK